MIMVVFACYFSIKQMLDLCGFWADQELFKRNQYCPRLINPDLQACIFLQPQVKLSARASSNLVFVCHPFVDIPWIRSLICSGLCGASSSATAALQCCTCIDRAIDGHLWDAAGRAQCHVIWQMQIKRSQNMALPLAFSTRWINIGVLETAMFLLYSTSHLQC